MASAAPLGEGESQASLSFVELVADAVGEPPLERPPAAEDALEPHA
jgi:hypothetical protein